MIYYFFGQKNPKRYIHFTPLWMRKIGCFFLNQKVRLIKINNMALPRIPCFVSRLCWKFLRNIFYWIKQKITIVVSSMIRICESLFCIFLSNQSYSQTWANDHLPTATTIGCPNMSLYITLTYLWTTATCQQRPQIWGPKGGRCTQVWLCFGGFLLCTYLDKDYLEINSSSCFFTPFSSK